MRDDQNAEYNDNYRDYIVQGTEDGVKIKFKFFHCLSLLICHPEWSEGSKGFFVPLRITKENQHDTDKKGTGYTNLTGA